MPRRAAKPCRRPGCPGHVDRGVCSVCGPVRQEQRSEYDQRRKSASARGYGRRWQRLRLMQLRNEPLCRHCAQQGRTTPATEVDHILAKRFGGADALDNLQSLCRSCHARKTNQENKGRGYMPSSIPVVIVAGPPGSGKTTYVGEHMTVGDLVVDYDALFVALSGRPWYNRPVELTPFVAEARDAVIRRLARPSDVRRAWIITAQANAEELLQLKDDIEAKLVILDIDFLECMRRIANDDRRRDNVELWRPILQRWFSTWNDTKHVIEAVGRGD